MVRFCVLRKREPRKYKNTKLLLYFCKLGSFIYADKMLTALCLLIVVFVVIVAIFSDGKIKNLSVLEVNLNTEGKLRDYEKFTDDMLPNLLTNC